MEARHSSGRLVWLVLQSLQMHSTERSQSYEVHGEAMSRLDEAALDVNVLAHSESPGHDMRSCKFLNMLSCHSAQNQVLIIDLWGLGL